MLIETILLFGNLSVKLISRLLIIFQMKSATKRLKSQKHASWTKSLNGSGEIAAISPSVNSNIWRRYFPANSIWHATSARYWREAWKWLNFRSETGFKTSDTKKSIALTRTRNKLRSQILQCPWKGKGNFIPASSKRLAKMKATAILGTVDDSSALSQFIWGIFSTMPAVHSDRFVLFIKVSYIMKNSAGFTK